MVLRHVAEGQSGLPVPNSTKSYWHTQPSKKLTGYRSTPDLPSTADTIVVGTGMTGSFAARFLKASTPSSRLLVLEAREACWGATGRNGGHCQPFLYGASEEVARFELETYSFLRDLCEKENVPCDWRSVAGVHAMLSDDVWEVAKAAVPRLAKKVPDFADKIVAVGPEGIVSGGGEPGEWAAGLTLERLRMNQPGVKGALVQQYAASMWPYKLVCWVLEKLVAEHSADEFNLQTNTAVTGVTKDAESGKWVVQTPRGKVAANKVLLATNAYTSRLLPEFADLIVPVRGQISALLPPEPRIALDYSYCMFGTLKDENGDATTRDEYLVQRPLPNGELILGGGRHAAKGMAVGEWHDDSVEEPVARWLCEELEPVLDLGERKDGKKAPQAQGLKASMEWTGIMGYSRDSLPWIGPVPTALGGGEGLFVASGFTGHGMPRCALSGRGVARMMTGDVQGHGLPAAFLASAERAVKTRETCGRVGSVDEMETMIADLMET